MARYRSALPQLDGGFFLTDGGIETTLIFHEGLELPDFAAFHVLKTEQGTAALRKYFRTYAAIAERHGAGLILESATWRASADWGATWVTLLAREALAHAELAAGLHLAELGVEGAIHRHERCA
jgi:S-methylmethionine-dependent homocysteine/selenocysteine methylase